MPAFAPRPLSVIARRDFWNARTINAVLGALLTIGAGLGSMAFGERYRKEITEIEERTRVLDVRIDAIERATFEFQLFEATGTLVQVLGASQAIPEPLRDPIRQLMYVDRNHSFKRIVGELYPTNLERFRRTVAEYDELVREARRGDLAAANKVIEIERDQNIAVRQLQAKLIAERFDAAAAKQKASQKLELYTTIGFTIQQIGFVIVLLSGLVANYLAEQPRSPASG